MSDTDQKLLAAALKRLEILRRADAFDPMDLASRPTPAQQEVINDFGHIKTQWIVAGNQSGKSQTCARLVAWFLTNTHPIWRRPAAWGEEPLLVIIAARTGKQIEESLWPKVRSFLEPGTYKEIRLGNILQRIEILAGVGAGNRIVFQSLENPNIAADRLQSYVAHLVWIDEMPPTMKVLAEAMVRRNTRDGYFLASFTPLVLNEGIRKMVDAATLPHAKKYRFRMFDNPAYAAPDRQAQVLDSMATLPAHVRATRLDGDWTVNDDAVYHFDWDLHVRMPEGYSPLWRHVESVDPALKSALGYTLWAEDPNTALWYCIDAAYIKGILVPTDLVRACQERGAGRNIVRRVADPHEVWFIQTAAAMGISYTGVHRKNDRKAELIKQLQEGLGRRFFLTPLVTDLHAEFQECRWSAQTDGRIVNASSYHLLDGAQYFADNVPKAEHSIRAASWQDWLWKANEERKTKRDKATEKAKIVIQRRAGQRPRPAKTIKHPWAS